MESLQGNAWGGLTLNLPVHCHQEMTYPSFGSIVKFFVSSRLAKQLKWDRQINVSEHGLVIDRYFNTTIMDTASTLTVLLL